MDAPTNRTLSDGQRPAFREGWGYFALIAALFVLILLPRIGSGTLWQNDELLTANRAREMIVRGDPLAVTRNFVPDFKKPPLQYWLGAAALRLLPDRRELAVRLPSLLYGALCLLATAWAARACFPEGDPALAMRAVLALAGCGYFIHMSRVALLDTGAAFHLTLAVGGCQLARRDARWHWFVGLQCVLGAWQKAPFAFAAWGIVLVLRACKKDAPLSPRGRLHLDGALAASALAALGWWLLQWLRFGPDTLLAAGQQQTGTLLRAHNDNDLGWRPYLYWFWMARDWAIPGLCAPLAAASVLFRKTDRDNPRLVECAAICLIFGAAIAALPYRAERYLIVITPLLAILTARWLGEMAQRLPLGRLPAGWARWFPALALASAGPVAAWHYFSPVPAPRTELLAAARQLGRSLRPGEEVLFSREPNPAFSAGNFVLFYSDIDRPLRIWPITRIQSWLASAQASTLPSRGLCNRREWAALQRDFPALQFVSSQGDWVVWRMPMAGQPP